MPLTSLQLSQNLDRQFLRLAVVLVDVDVYVEASLDDYKIWIVRRNDEITAYRPHWLLTSRQIQGDSRA